MHGGTHCSGSEVSINHCGIFDCCLSSVRVNTILSDSLEQFME